MHCFCCVFSVGVIGRYFAAITFLRWYAVVFIVLFQKRYRALFWGDNVLCQGMLLFLLRFLKSVIDVIGTFDFRGSAGRRMSQMSRVRRADLIPDSPGRATYGVVIPAGHRR
jgi:hypothetical protein